VVGGSGAGHAAKIANNMLCAANLVLVAEAVRLGQAAGVDAKDLLEGVKAGSGRSGVSEVNFPKWILNEAFDSGFTMGLMRKDVNLAMQLAQSEGVALEGFAAIARIWLEGSKAIPDSADFNEITKYGDEGAKE
ncbi:MAG: NAD-binding protein, partial [Geminicoccaceae bacterium]